MKYQILFNPKSNNGHGRDDCDALTSLLTGELIWNDVTKITDQREFYEGLDPEDIIILSGGDGTVNHFINDTADLDIKNRIDYFATGTGNDFLSDLKVPKGTIVENANKYFKNLPTVTVKGKRSYFINGIGYGIDGYCCEVGDRLRATSDKPINYAGIAIKGLLFHFKPLDATVIVDGVEKKYKKVWMAPTMVGRYYGGGMIPTPEQDRLDPDHKLSLCVWHGSGKLKTLMAFPSIFKGEHLKHSEMCEVLTGHTITVSFTGPCALQIDGETVLNVESYTAESYKEENA